MCLVEKHLCVIVIYFCHFASWGRREKKLIATSLHRRYFFSFPLRFLTESDAVCVFLKLGCLMVHICHFCLKISFNALDGQQPKWLFRDKRAGHGCRERNQQSADAA